MILDKRHAVHPGFSREMFRNIRTDNWNQIQADVTQINDIYFQFCLIRTIIWYKGFRVGLPSNRHGSSPYTGIFTCEFYNVDITLNC